MTEPFSVLIPDGESDFALFAAHCLAPHPNVRLHVLSVERWASIRFSRFCHTYTFKRFLLTDESLPEIITQLVKKYEIDVLLPTGSNWISYLVNNRDIFSKFVAIPPLPDPASLAIADNKWLFAQFLEDNQLLGPPTILVTNDDMFYNKLQEIKFPVLLKPTVAMGGEGIKRFETPAELKCYLEQQKLEAIKDQFIVQSLLSGSMLDANILSERGNMLALTIQRGIIPNRQKYAAAGALEFIEHDELKEITYRLVAALSWSGFANVDTLYDRSDRQFKILEVNARFWGSLRGSLAAGVSFPYLACLAALNIPFPLPQHHHARYFHSKTALREILLRPLRRNLESPFTLRETGIASLLADPVAESIRAFRQEVLGR
ncbi:MAG: ATP-grasp domain-containing protein [Anaerolineales bacterium]|nr:ATP-grasp domain-containing protein [Anaerolineales bacterium]